MQTVLLVVSCLLAVTCAMPQPRIVGGSTVTRGQVPYQVSLRTKMNQHFCGGALLARNWIITSGHCVASRQASEIIAVAGSVSLREGNGHVVTKVIVHPKFEAEGLLNDIALVQTETNFIFNMIVQPANIGGEYIESDVEALLTGWGQTTYPGDLSEDLQGITMTTISNDDCVAAYASSEGSPDILETNVCAVSAQDTGACMGDSGSALVVNRQIIGLVSWGLPCAQNRPDVFTRVSLYRDWVVETVTQNA